MKTAVEWLIEQISSSKYFYNLMEEIESRSTTVQPNGILHQAKAMEKEQMKEIREMLIQGALTSMSCASAVVEFDRLTKTTKTMKQTAVEWLVEQFENHRATFFKLNEKEERVITLAGRDVVEQAKAMQEKQIKTAYIEGYETNFYAPEEYYNKTYDKRNS